MLPADPGVADSSLPLICYEVKLVVSCEAVCDSLPAKQKLHNPTPCVVVLEYTSPSIPLTMNTWPFRMEEA